MVTISHIGTVGPRVMWPFNPVTVMLTLEDPGNDPPGIPSNVIAALRIVIQLLGTEANSRIIPTINITTLLFCFVLIFLSNIQYHLQLPEAALDCWLTV